MQEAVMKCARIIAPNKIKIEELPIPKPDKG